MEKGRTEYLSTVRSDIYIYEDCIPDLIIASKSLEKQINKSVSSLSFAKQRIRRSKEDLTTKWFLNAIHDTVYEGHEIEILSAQKDRIDKSVRRMLYRGSSGKITESMVEDAKERNDITYVMETLGIVITNETGRKTYAHTPFKDHEENASSFIGYNNDNTYHCFSTNRSGDVISLVMGVKKIDFLSAVKYLMEI